MRQPPQFPSVVSIGSPLMTSKLEYLVDASRFQPRLIGVYEGGVQQRTYDDRYGDDDDNEMTPKESKCIPNK